MTLNPESKEILQKLKDDFVHFSAKCLKIRTKPGNIEPFLLNKAQLHIHSRLQEQLETTGKVRALILKGRQQGCSTYVGARFYHKVTHNFGLRAFILTHLDDATSNLYDMVKRYYEFTPDIIKRATSKSNAKELIFGNLQSGYKLGTAKNKAIGRSATIQLFHGSEVAFWDHAEEHSTGILQAIPHDSGEVILESTANGVGNYFHQEWQKAESGLSDYIAIFVPWYWQDEYKWPVPDDFHIEADELDLKNAYGLTNEQIVWRRKKIIQLSVNGIDGKRSFNQEYPSCIVATQRVGTTLGILPIEHVAYLSHTINGKILNKWNKGLKETIKLETELGYTLECTTDHKIHSENNFIEALETIGKNITLCAPKFAQQMYKCIWKYMPCADSAIIIDELMGLFLGFFMGDGSYYHDTLSFAFNSHDQDCVALIQKLTFDLFGVNLSYRATSKNGAELRGSNKKLRESFAALEIIEVTNYATKRKVCVPECIWRSPKEVVKNFLSGIFETDGFAGYNHARVVLFSKHEQFLKDIQLLLLGFGITSKRTAGIRKNGTGCKYFGTELSLRSSEARKFVEEIGFVSKRKIERQEKWLKEFEHGRPGKPILLNDKVKRIINNGLKETYDLEIENTHVFDANGFLVHNCPTDAFILSGEDSYIKPEVVMRARKNKDVEPYGPLLVGCDPARFGDDRTVIIKRRGRHSGDMCVYIKKDTMEIVGLLQLIIRDEKPDKVFIDVGGLGAGIVDRLNELGFSHIVVPVNAGASPYDANKFRNKRAEMWAQLNEWLNGDMPVSIPDSDELQSDLCGIKYKIDSNSRLQMESKEEMKKRGLRSSDCADALCLTFALPDSAVLASKARDANQVALELNLNFDARLKALGYRR